MKRYIGIICIALLFFGMQSCMIKKGANMEFAKGLDMPGDAEIVSIKVPGILMKAFIRGEIRELKEDDPVLAMALKKIKNIKLMAVSGGSQKVALYDHFSKYLVRNDFEELMSINSDGAKISINTRTKRNRIKNIMLGITDEGDHVFVDLKSDLDLDELNELIEHYENTHQSKKGQSEEKSE